MVSISIVSFIKLYCAYRIRQFAVGELKKILNLVNILLFHNTLKRFHVRVVVASKSFCIITVIFSSFLVLMISQFSP